MSQSDFLRTRLPLLYSSNKWVRPLHFTKRCRWTSTWIKFFQSNFVVYNPILPSTFRSLGGSAEKCVLEKFSTRTVLVLSIEAIQFFILLCAFEPRQFAFPIWVCGYLYEFLHHTMQSRVWEYVHFCLHELDEPPCRLPGATSPMSSHSNLILTLPRSPILVCTVGFWSESHMECRILGVILSKKDRCLQRWSHEYSPNKRILVTLFHLFVWRTIQQRSQLLTHFFFEWDWSRKHWTLLSSPSHCQHPNFLTVGTGRPA